MSAAVGVPGGGGVDAAIDLACHQALLFLLVVGLLAVSFARKSLSFPPVPFLFPAFSPPVRSLIKVLKTPDSGPSPAAQARRGYRPRAGRARVRVEELSDRDWAVLADVARLQYVTGTQLERLHFTANTERGRAVVRSRVLSRLVDRRLLMTFGRRVGGVRGGSGGLVYALDSGGQKLLNERHGTTARVRRPWPHLPHAIDHTLAVSELFVALIERCRAVDGVTLAGFETEPACWWPDGHGGQLKPDAHVVIHNATTAFHWWIELDRGTERLPVVRRKLAAYAAFARSGSSGPDDVVPRVVVAVPTTTRCAEITDIASRIDDRGLGLVLVAVAADTPGLLIPDESSRS